MLGVCYVSIVAVLLIVADNTFSTFRAGRGPQGTHPFFVPFVAALAAQLGLVANLALRSRADLRRLPRVPQALLSGTLGFTVIVPLSLWATLGTVPARGAVLAAAVCAVALMLYALGRRLRRWPTARCGDSVSQASAWRSRSLCCCRPLTWSHAR